MSYVEINDAQREDVWFFDSRCSNHMCGDKSLFCELNEEFRHKVKLGNNTRMAVLGKGNVKLEVSGFTHVVSDAEKWMLRMMVQRVRKKKSLRNQLVVRKLMGMKKYHPVLMEEELEGPRGG